jgi:hypothetical protein
MRELQPNQMHGMRPLGGDFEAKIGSAAQPLPEHLRNGLWAASQLLAGSSNAFKRVLVFSADPDPVGAGPKAETLKCAAALLALPCSLFKGRRPS